jgi:nucleoside-diphosphate-sugar epimerase
MTDLTSHPPFVVTGASGYLASWVVWELLSRGARVHGTVRDPDDRAKVQHLWDMAAELPGSLGLFRADLLEAGSFDEVCLGAGAVLHTASPFIVGKVKDAQAQLIEPAVEGTRNVLRSVDAADSVKKVVLTSSVAAIYGDAKDLEDVPGGVFTEECWNQTSTPTHQPYNFSKTEAEKVAWKMAEAQDRWALATINPGFILGPSQTPRQDSESIKLITDFVTGRFKTGVPAFDISVVDVREVARAHVEAAIRPEAKGRYILVNTTKSFLEIGEILRQQLGGKQPLPKALIPGPLLYVLGPLNGISWKHLRRNNGYPLRFDNRRSRQELGIDYRPIDETLREQAQQILSSRSR